MAYIVGNTCRKCPQKYCVEVCPVDAFTESEMIMVIDPEKCIDCGACSVECPFNAICADVDLPK